MIVETVAVEAGTCWLDLSVQGGADGDWGVQPAGDCEVECEAGQARVLGQAWTAAELPVHACLA